MTTAVGHGTGGGGGSADAPEPAWSDDPSGFPGQWVDAGIGPPDLLQREDRGDVAVHVGLRPRCPQTAEVLVDARDLLDHAHHLGVAVVGLQVTPEVRDDSFDGVIDNQEFMNEKIADAVGRIMKQLSL